MTWLPFVSLFLVQLIKHKLIWNCNWNPSLSLICGNLNTHINPALRDNFRSVLTCTYLILSEQTETDLGGETLESDIFIKNNIPKLARMKFVTEKNTTSFDECYPEQLLL